MFPALHYAKESRAETLFEAITSDPATFAELVSLAFKPEHGEQEDMISDGQRNAATNAWKILRACKRQPGTRQDGSIDPDVFNQFIDAAREQCARPIGYTGANMYLGKFLRTHLPMKTVPDHSHLRGRFLIVLIWSKCVAALTSAR